MNLALQQFPDDFSNVDGSGPTLRLDNVSRGPHTLPNPQSLPVLRPFFRGGIFPQIFVIWVLAVGWLGWDLPSEPHFVDESAYISQSFYGDLFIHGDFDSADWLEYAGYDLPPLPKYLINLGLRSGGFRRPPKIAAVAWYGNTGRQFVSIPALTAARWPSVLLGAVGCAAIYALGSSGFDRRVGALAALFLMTNPLYLMHSRRAMSDVQAEALILASLAVGLWAWRRVFAARKASWPDYLAYGMAGVLVGLATLAKLNGALAGFVLAGWAMLALLLPGTSSRAKFWVVLATAIAGFLSLMTFVAGNPFVTARPRGAIDPRLEPIARLSFPGRLGAVADHRVAVSIGASRQFPDDALTTTPAQVEAVAVQGFGRFGPFGAKHGADSTIRFDWRQDWGAVIWLPLVATGFAVACSWGRRQARQGEPPSAWAIALQSAIAMVVVTLFIPLAWDRYFLSIQAGSALLGSVAIVAGVDIARRPFARKPIAGPTS